MILSPLCTPREIITPIDRENKVAYGRRSALRPYCGQRSAYEKP